MNRVSTPFGLATVLEVVSGKIYVELDVPHRHGNRDYTRWLFDKEEVQNV